jgi:hypothetical protein
MLLSKDTFNRYIPEGYLSWSALAGQDFLQRPDNFDDDVLSCFCSRITCIVSVHGL